MKNGVKPEKGIKRTDFSKETKTDDKREKLKMKRQRKRLRNPKLRGNKDGQIRNWEE